MNSIDPKCNKTKWAYDKCFNEWFKEDFLTEGKKFPEGYVPCEEFLKPYNACINKAIEDRELDISGTREKILEFRDADLEAAQKEREKANSEK